MHHVVSGIQTELPSVPIGTDSTQAVPIVVVTLLVALVGGGIMHGLSRKRSCLLRIIAVVVFTVVVVTGLLIALWVAYDPSHSGVPQ